MVNVKENIGIGYYTPPAFSRAHAQNRRAFIEGVVPELDNAIACNNDMDSRTRGLYNDLRGLLLHLADIENDNVKVGE